ncbi:MULTISPECIES: peptidoglycan-binding domain-containing protein [unclassified Streptomyces]|uniref:peptidoglycan-binding domain-containing protein n=1 Tax=unclassified Streptomyces TaxID=2593676 RepID=UPI002366E064|nr:MULTISPECIES: peptidoglycan-binding domain-containing protein [unclassified Streptomyces]MDF3147076.1 peptidoglycan-binding domain-containing protein [Streptomyces sp. T21Q-yed]WDF40701.1 peptidoglycan-binding domain-containing protein [Streptomyces sp. T12]
MLKKIAAAVSTATLAATGLAITASSAEAASYPTCNSSKKHYISSTRFVVQPYYTGTGSRDCVMGYGALSSGVTRLQFAINDCYNGISNIATDGRYGSETRNAVKYVQEQTDGDATVDGVYGPETRKAMYWGVYIDGHGFYDCQKTQV